MDGCGGGRTDRSEIESESVLKTLSRRRVVQSFAWIGIGSAVGVTSIGTGQASHAGNYAYSTGTDDREVHKTTPDGQTEWRYTGHSSIMYDVAVDADGYVYASGGNELHKISPTGDPVWQYTEHASTMRGVAVDADGYVYSISFDEELHKITPDGQTVWKYTGHSNDVFSVALDADGYVYSATGSDGDLHKITPDGDFEWAYTSHSDSVYDLAVDGDGHVYTASGGGEVHKISSEGNRVWRYAGDSNTIWGVAVDDEGYVYSSGRDDGAVHKISPDGNTVWQYTGHSDDVRELSVDSEGYVYSTSDDEELHKIAPDGDVVWQYTGHGGGVRGSAVDNEYTAAFGFSGSDTSDGKTDTDGFAVDITDTNAPVEAGETLEVTAEVENTGDETDTQDVTLEINGQEVETGPLTLDSGESQQLTLTTEAPDRNGVGVRVASDDDADNQFVLLDDADDADNEEAGAIFEIIGTNTPVSESDILEVDVEITNTGEEELTQAVDFDVDAQREETREVTLGAGETTIETFTWEVDHRSSVGLRAAGADDWDNTFLLLADTDFTLTGL